MNATTHTCRRPALLLRAGIVMVLATLLSLTAAAKTSTGKIKVASYHITTADTARQLSAWDERLPLISRQLHKLSASVVCMQGVGSKHLTDMLQSLPEYALAPSIAVNDTSRQQHCPVLYHRKQMKFVQSGSFVIDERPVNWAMLEESKSGCPIMILSVQRPPLTEAERQEWAASIKIQLSKLVSTTNVVLCGDLGIERDEQAFNTMLTRMLPLADAWAVAKQRHRSTVPDEQQDIISDGLDTADDNVGARPAKHRTPCVMLISPQVKANTISSQQLTDRHFRHLSLHPLITAELVWKQ